jgi:hypothetical protein
MHRNLNSTTCKAYLFIYLYTGYNVLIADIDAVWLGDPLLLINNDAKYVIFSLQLNNSPFHPLKSSLDHFPRSDINKPTYLLQETRPMMMSKTKDSIHVAVLNHL